ncbi:MAG: hypothetical protein IJW64_02725 [Clostridia bacterium]|nr:hypothetical protein [Clostridia bacterium]
MSSFVGKIFSKLTSSVLNLIVIAISTVAILSSVVLPPLKINAQVTFTEEISNMLFPQKENPTEEDELIYLVADELVKEKVKLSFEIKLSAMDAVSCSLDGSAEKTRNILLSYTDTVAESVDDEVLAKVEIAVTKASVTTIIKKQITVLSDSLDDKTDEVMQNIGVDDEYVGAKTQDVLNSIKAENATVDSVTDTIMSVVDDVDVKLQDSVYKDEVDSLDEESRAEIREAVEQLVNSLADENGNIDGDALIDSLFAELLSGGNDQASLSPSTNATFYQRKVLFSQENPSQNKSVKELLKEKLRELVTEEVVKLAKTLFLAITLAVAIVIIAWAYLILKILLKMSSPNPLVKLKTPITVSWIPFVVLFALPNVIFKLLANPPQMLLTAIEEQGLTQFLSLGKAISVSATSSTIIPFVLSIVLLVFGVIYSARRKAIAKDLKKQKTNV